MDNRPNDLSILILALSFSFPAMGCGGGGGATQENDSLAIRQEIDNVRLEGSGPDSFTTFETAHYIEWNWEGWEVAEFDHLQNIHFSPFETPFYVNVKKKLVDGTTEPIIATTYLQECSLETHSHEISFESIPTDMEVSFHIGDDQAILTYTPVPSTNARVLFTLTFDCRGGEVPPLLIPPSLGGGTTNTPIVK